MRISSFLLSILVLQTQILRIVASVVPHDSFAFLGLAEVSRVLTTHRESAPASFLPRREEQESAAPHDPVAQSRHLALEEARKLEEERNVAEISRISRNLDEILVGVGANVLEKKDAFLTELRLRTSRSPNHGTAVYLKGLWILLRVVRNERVLLTAPEEETKRRQVQVLFDSITEVALPPPPPSGATSPLAAPDGGGGGIHDMMPRTYFDSVLHKLRSKVFVHCASEMGTDDRCFTVLTMLGHISPSELVDVVESAFPSTTVELSWTEMRTRHEFDRGFRLQQFWFLGMTALQQLALNRQPEPGPRPGESRDPGFPILLRAIEVILRSAALRSRSCGGALRAETKELLSSLKPLPGTNVVADMSAARGSSAIGGEEGHAVADPRAESTSSSESNAMVAGMLGRVLRDEHNASFREYLMDLFAYVIYGV